MEKNLLLSRENCQIVTDDSCCLSYEERRRLGVEVFPFMASAHQIANHIESLLQRKEFILFVGTTPSLSIVNDMTEDAIEILDKKDKSLNAAERVHIFNTSCFSGGLGMFVTLFSHHFNSKARTYDELLAYNQFLANHIAHFFVKPNNKRWNNLIYVPRTGPIDFDSGKFRGNVGVYNYLAANFRDFAYHRDEKIWICHSGDLQNFEHAQDLARQFKKYYSDSKIDLTHELSMHTIASVGDDAIACFFLSTDVRADNPGHLYRDSFYREIARKNHIAKDHITEISRIAQAFHKTPHPSFH